MLDGFKWVKMDVLGLIQALLSDFWNLLYFLYDYDSEG